MKMSKVLDSLLFSRFIPDDELDTNLYGLGLIKRSEKFEPNWYLCPADVWTIGYGTTDGLFPNVNRRSLKGPITEPFAEELLLLAVKDLFEPGVEKAIKVEITGNMFSACVSLAYNIGVDAFSRSTLCKRINEKRFDLAALEFPKWVYAGGRVMRGLVTRRAAERALFDDRADEDVVRRLMDIQPMHPVAVERIPVHILPRPKPLPGLDSEGNMLPPAA